MTQNYSFYAKCDSTQCPKHSECARALSPSSPMSYWIYCQPNGDYSYNDFEWFVQAYVQAEQVVEQATEQVKVEEVFEDGNNDNGNGSS